MSNAPAVREGGTIDLPATGPGRALGQKRRPQLRLALGYRDETKRGAPVKTDYFVPKGDDRAVQKFQTVYGPKPRAIDIRLPGSLGGFLDIRHVAFAGGQSDGGGVLKAIGQVNFALEGSLGGPDKLTVFNVVETGEKNGKPTRELQADEVWIDDVTDPQAQALGVYLQASVTFGIPDVLGFGGVCELRSRGKETIDTLWETAVDIYGSLGANASMVLRPKLVLKESTMMTPVGSKAQVFVVDMYVPESLDEIVGRLREMRELLPAGPMAALYGPQGPREIVVAAEDFDEVGAEALTAGQPTGAEAAETAAPSSPPAAGSFDVPDDVRAAQEAAGYVVTLKDPRVQGKTLAQINADPEAADVFFEWCLGAKNKDMVLRDAVRDYVRVRRPEWTA